MDTDQHRTGVGLQAQYVILGLDVGASSDDVKKAYRKLAVLHHPDKGGDVEQFRAITEAYDAINRATQLPPDGVPSDMFSSLFSQTRAEACTPSIVREAHCTLDELYTGCEKEFQVERQVLISKDAQTCGTCEGKRFRTETRVLQGICSICNGKGAVSQTKNVLETLLVFVPRGASDGQRIRVRGKANEELGMTTGDFICVVRQKEHSRFRRRGPDLFLKESISLCEALCGFSRELMHLDGRRLLLFHSKVYKPRGGLREQNRGIAAWEVLEDTDCPDVEVVALGKTSDPEVLKRACEGELKSRGLDVTGFVMKDGEARFFSVPYESLLASRKLNSSATLYLRVINNASDAVTTLLSVPDEGMPLQNSCGRGRLFLDLHVAFPDELTSEQKEQLRLCLGEGSSSSDRDSTYDGELEMVEADPDEESAAPEPYDDDGDTAGARPFGSAGAQRVQCAQQ